MISISRRDPEFYNEAKQEIAQNAENKHLQTIRKCIICGETFQARGSQTTCNNIHYRECVVCGAPFEIKHLSDQKKTCSKKCSIELRKQSMTEIERVCEYCGKKFMTSSPVAKYCEGPHFRVCQICGQRFEVSLLNGLDNIPRACSLQCKSILYRETSLRRYGFESPHQRSQSRNGFKRQSIENAQQRAETCMSRYGVDNPAKSNEVKEKISESISSTSIQEQMRNTMQQRYGVDHAMQSRELASKHSGTQFSQYAVDGTRVDSSWERDVYNFFLRNRIDFEYNTYQIEYEYNGKKHVTTIDFKIGDFLFEVKGSHLLDGAYSNASGVVPIDVKLALYKKHHVIIITDQTHRDLFGKPNSRESNGLKYLNKCPEPLIGVDIALFNNPEFPFAADRPECFYRVRVDGKPSSLEGFYNEEIRWKMILNRANYTGGFIDSKQVLTAMNVTRTCKQPSWFSKSLAKRIIETYCKSDLIFDPFAGWGARHDAAIELGKRYKGCDLNPELVEWHTKQGRNIALADANTFATQEPCSVFICPPYSDPVTGRCFEDYNFDGFDQSAKSLSQCDWLKIVMKNAPNAREYVMVCKIVDDDFKQYVVETLTNESHLGSNNEYVVIVPN